MDKLKSRESIKWAFDFLQADLKTRLQRPLDVLILRDELLQFLGLRQTLNAGIQESIQFPITDDYYLSASITGPSTIVLIPDPAEKPKSLWAFEREDFEKFQLQGRQLIEAWAWKSLNTRMAVESFSSTRYDIVGADKAGHTVPTQLRFRTIAWGSGNVACGIGPVRDVFLTALFMRASTLQSYILRCKDENCRKVFLQIDWRQEYCSRKHANRAAVRRHYRNKKDQERELLKRKQKSKKRR